MRKRTLEDKAFSGNTVCQDTRDHAWESTTAPNFRRCTRSGCHAAQRLDGNGQWVDVAAKPSSVSVPSGTNSAVGLWG